MDMTKMEKNEIYHRISQMAALAGSLVNLSDSVEWTEPDEVSDFIHILEILEQLLKTTAREME